MRLLLVGAFPYPHDQGSQVYFQEQAIALRAAGAEVSLLTYATHRRARKPGADAGETEPRARALAGFEHRTTAAWTAPRSPRSGPGWGKPLADLGLIMTLRDAVASRFRRHDAFDAILTHNAEATLCALHGLPRVRPAILYCVHTLLGVELSTYLNPLESEAKMALSKEPGEARQRARSRHHGIDALGRRLDRWLAARVDGWIALTHASSSVMSQASSAPGALLPPPLPDPLRGLESATQEDARERDRVARAHGLTPGGYFLYSGNLDGYQELALLAAVARRLGADAPPIVVASHDERLETSASALPGLLLRPVETADEMQALLAGARASLVMRRAEGGFPIKLANSLALGTPPIALLDREWGLVDGQNALIGRRMDPVASVAEAILRLERDDRLVAQLSAGARALYRAQHRPEQIARGSLGLIQRVIAQRDGIPAGTRTPGSAAGTRARELGG